MPKKMKKKNEKNENPQLDMKNEKRSLSYFMTKRFFCLMASKSSWFVSPVVPSSSMASRSTVSAAMHHLSIFCESKNPPKTTTLK